MERSVSGRKIRFGAEGYGQDKEKADAGGYCKWRRNLL